MASTTVPESKEAAALEPSRSTVSDVNNLDGAIANERQLSFRDTLRLWPKAIMFSFVISLAVIMEGYDTNLLGNFYAFPEFKNRFGDQVDPEGGMLVSARWQTILSNSTQVRLLHKDTKNIHLTPVCRLGPS